MVLGTYRTACYQVKTLDASSRAPPFLCYNPPINERLLSHYLFWIMLLPFAVAHKGRDDSLLLEMDNRSYNRLSMKKLQKVRSISPQH